MRWPPNTSWNSYECLSIWLNPLVEWLKNQSNVGMSYVHLWNNWHMTSKGACGGTIVWTSTLTTWMGMDINLEGYHREHELGARNTNVHLLQRFGRLLEILHKFCTSHELMNVGGVFLRKYNTPQISLFTWVQRAKKCNTRVNE
jgi:hypothetical protein